MNDRLGELAGAANWADDDEIGGGSGGDVEMGEQPAKQGSNSNAKQPRHMEQFFKEVDSIKNDIEFVHAATRSIGEINEQALQATTTEQENQLSRQLRPLVDDTNKRAKRTKTMLGLLKEDNASLQASGDAKAGDLRYVKFLPSLPL
jgi:t-SNARE complex subunit (syntaxin)